MAPLDLSEVRRVARATGVTEIYYNVNSRVVAFRNQESRTRINVYYTTGTVGTNIWITHGRAKHNSSAAMLTWNCCKKYFEIRGFTSLPAHTENVINHMYTTIWVFLLCL